MSDQTDIVIEESDLPPSDQADIIIKESDLPPSDQADIVINESDLPPSDQEEGIIKEVNNKLEGKTMRDILPIEENFTEIIRMSDIPGLVEAPLVLAVLELYKRNILTIDSTANRKMLWSSPAIAQISIELASLSERNINIARSLGAEFNVNGCNVKLQIPFESDTKALEVSEIAHEMAKKFFKQPPEWIKTWELYYDIADLHGEERLQVIRDREEKGNYYDEQTGFIFYSKEIYDKYKEYYL